MISFGIEDDLTYCWVAGRNPSWAVASGMRLLAETVSWESRLWSRLMLLNPLAFSRHALPGSGGGL